MSAIRKAVTAGATFSVALGLGFLVQNGDASAARYSSAIDRPEAETVQSIMKSTNASGASVFGMPEVVTTSLPSLTNVNTLSAVEETHDDLTAPKMGTVLAVPTGDCDADLIAAPKPAAMVELIVLADCHADADFTLTHQGMVFSGRTDKTGRAALQVPALSTDAVFAVSFDNMEVARVQVTVADFQLYDRSVLQWRGTDNLQLHALEFGATFGDPGHVWSASANLASLAQSGERGFITRLGTPDADIPFQAEVYTFPSGLSNRDGQIVLQVGVAVTKDNCNRTIKAQSIQTHSGKMLVGKDLNIPMPDCRSVGDSLMLRDMMTDVTLALR